jgi:hypothetical protein
MNNKGTSQRREKLKKVEAICLSSLEKWLFKTFVYFLIDLFVEL